MMLAHKIALDLNRAQTAYFNVAIRARVRGGSGVHDAGADDLES